MDTAYTFINTAYKVIEILLIAGGVGGILYRLGKAVSKFEAIGITQSTQITELKNEVKGLSVVVTAVAVQKAEMTAMREDIAIHQKWIDELRRGIGFITPQKA